MLKHHLKLFAAIILGSFAAFAGFYSTAFSQDAPKREITNIAGDLYRFQNNFHYSVFLVTPEGVIATDPINAEAAAWLESEIEKRFSLPIKYLVLSHDHPDHSSGGEVFADSALVVAHENAKAAIVGEGRPTAVPNITFSDSLTLELGGKTVELIYLGPGHSDNLIVMRFPEERAVFVVDLVTVNRLPYKNLSDSYFPDWISALKGLESLDFDILAPGHGVLGTKADLVAHRGYMEKLYNEILAAARAGKSLEEMKASITMDEYKDWGQYDKWRELNIEGIYGRVALQRRGN